MQGGFLKYKYNSIKRKTEFYEIKHHLLKTLLYKPFQLQQHPHVLTVLTQVPQLGDPQHQCYQLPDENQSLYEDCLMLHHI